jgi:hypothetical protein
MSRAARQPTTLLLWANYLFRLGLWPFDCDVVRGLALCPCSDERRFE